LRRGARCRRRARRVSRYRRRERCGEPRHGSEARNALAVTQLKRVNCARAVPSEAGLHL
jgi:hypothetical protein